MSEEDIEPHPVLAALRAALSDERMAFLAMLAVLVTAAPVTFDLNSAWQSALTAADIMILAVFALEYYIGWRLAPDRAGFLRDPWRALDAFIIVALLVSILPLPTDVLGLSPILRLARVARVAVLGTRSSMRLSTRLASPTAQIVEGDMPFSAMALDVEESDAQLKGISWEEALQRIESQQEDWLFLSGVDADLLPAVAGRLGIGETVLRNKLIESAFPRLDRLERYATLFTWYPQLEETGGVVRVRRTGLLLVGTSNNVVVLARAQTDLVERLARRLGAADRESPVLVRATHALVKEVVGAYQRATEHLETRLIRVESLEPSMSDREFLAETFQLRNEITRVRTTLRHLAAVTRNLNSRRVAIRGFDSGELPQFQLLAGETADLFERVDDLFNNLGALVDMRLNISSFQMNKVMRLLAILTTLALIPAVVGGMLGMNTMDNPWPVSLPQVAFWVGAGMLFSMYLFAIKGWLR